jgi:hypothetical protein
VHPHRGSRLPCLLALTLAAALAGPAITAACSNECHEHSCVARIVVGPEPVTFTSAERFRLSEERLTVRLFVGGSELKLVRRDGRHGCRTRLRGAGTAATVSACGGSTPIEVTASRNWGGSVKMEIVYRARHIAQGVKGISASSGGGGGVESSGSGGVGAP